MRFAHLVVTGFCLVSLLFCGLYDSRAYTYVQDERHPDQTKTVLINHVRLTGWDFISGNMPKKLENGEGTSLPHYRWGAIGCAVALLLLASVSVVMKQPRRLMWTNFVLLFLFLVAFLQMDNFKNPYFEFISRTQFPVTSATIDTQMLTATKMIVVALELLTLFNLLYLVSWLFRMKRSNVVAEAQASS